MPPASSEPLGELPGVTRREYPGIRHELHNEPEGPAIIDDVVGWIREQVLPEASQTRFAIRRKRPVYEQEGMTALTPERPNSCGATIEAIEYRLRGAQRR